MPDWSIAMNFSQSAIRYRRTDTSEWVLSPVVFVCASALLLFNVSEALSQTVLLLAFVLFGGIALINRLSLELRDPRLRYINYIWIAKIGATIFLLHFGWIPELDPGSGSWGYDPQRFYLYSRELLLDDWVLPEGVLNYTGVLYFYAFWFKLFGANPYIPALINTFFTLYAVTVVLGAAYLIRPVPSPYTWRLGFAMVFPEVLWYDIMTSREGIVMALLTISSIKFSAGFLLEARNRNTALSLLIAGLAIALVAWMRTTMLLPMMAIVFLAMLYSSTLNYSKTFVYGIVAAAVFAGALVFGTGLYGSYDFAVSDVIGSRLATNSDQLEGMNWSHSSIGAALVPSGFFQALLYGLPRTLLYLIAPLPTIDISISGLRHGSWSDWQYLMVVTSSLINIAIIPLAGASLASMLIAGGDRRGLVFTLPFFVLLLSIGYGNQIVHERYRVMADLLLVGSVWHGSFANRYLIRNCYLIWVMILFLSGSFYMLYKAI